MGKPKLCTCKDKTKRRSVRSGNVEKVSRGNKEKDSPFKRLMEVANGQGNNRNKNQNQRVSSVGITPDSINRLIEACQGTQAYQRTRSDKGHARDHVYKATNNGGSDHNRSGNTSVPIYVAEYSKTDETFGKSGFFTETAQNDWAFHALTSNTAKTSFRKFNAARALNPTDPLSSKVHYFPSDCTNYQGGRKPKAEVCGHWFNGELEEIFIPAGTTVTYTDIQQHVEENWRTKFEEWSHCV